MAIKKVRMKPPGYADTIYPETSADIVIEDANHRFVTDAEKVAWNSKQNAIAGGATTITNSNLTTGRALISDSNGKVAVSAVTASELGYLGGVTTYVQTQLNGKAPYTHSHSATDITSGTLPDARLSGTYSGFTHKIDGANTVYTTPSSGSSNTSARTVYGLAEYRSSNASQVGAIVFIQNNTTSDIMYQFSIAGMLYNQHIFTMELQGYRATGAWSGIKKTASGTVDIQTRFGVTPDGKNCIILGDVGTTWSYPHISITRAMFSHTGASDAICTGWTTAVVTNLSTYTNVTATIADSPITGSITGNSGTSTKLATARTISLTGDVTGSVSFDGSANASITATVADDSHNHTIANIDSLQSVLDTKSATSHNHTLDGLSNTTITSNTSGEILKWNGTAWINNTLAEAGIQPSITGGASTIASSDLTASRALISNSSGKVAVSLITATELSYLYGATSPIQAQLDTAQKYKLVDNAGLPLSTSADLNAMTSSGWHLVGSTTANRPADYGVVEVIRRTSSHIFQRVMATTGLTYTRITSNGGTSWTPWKMLAEVVEYGQNANGKYIKFEDGTMIAYNRVIFNSHSISAVWGSWFISSADLTYAFPTTFYDNPVVAVHMENGSGDIAAWMNSTVTTASFKGRFARGIAGTVNAIVGWMAMGRWK